MLTDTTERSPTFCTPPFRKWDDPEASESWAFLFTAEATTEAAWPRLLRRAPQTIEWTDDDLHRLLEEPAASRQIAVVREIGLRELMRFRIGLDGIATRPVRPGDGVTAVVSEQDQGFVTGRDAAFADVLEAAAAAGGITSVIAVGQADRVADLLAPAGRRAAGAGVALHVPPSRFLLDPMTRLGTKMLLNALSTCTMVRLGRVLGNRMIWVVPSNLKLIDRATRYIRDLAGVPYEDACRALFATLEHIEPRRSTGRSYPAPVGVATMHLRHGVDLAEAERRLEATLATPPGTRP